jgi:hypothetical protein
MLSIVTAELQTANVRIFKEKSSHPDFLNIGMTRRHSYSG